MPRNAPTDLLAQNLEKLRGALEHSVTIQSARLTQVVDDLVARGTLSRAEADRLLGELVADGKSYAQGIMHVLDGAIVEAKDLLSAGVAPVMATAGRLAETVRQAPGLVGLGAKPARTTAPSAQPKPVADPIPGYGSLTVAEIRPQLAGLSAAELAKVRETEVADKGRKSLLAEIDQLLGES